MDKEEYEAAMLSRGYIKTPSGWIAHGEATPAQMLYHLDWMKNNKSK